MPAPIPVEIQARFDAVLKKHEPTHPGWCVMFNVDDQTYAIGPTQKLAVRDYDQAFGPVTKDTRPARHFLSNTVRITAAAVKPGVYRHFKGDTYHVLGAATHSETLELSVIYIPQSGPWTGILSYESPKTFLEWIEESENASHYYVGPRFTRLEEKKFIIDDSMEGWGADLVRRAASEPVPA